MATPDSPPPGTPEQGAEPDEAAARPRWATRGKLTLLAAAVVALAAVAAVTTVTVLANRWTYDEAAHQRVIEAAYGADYVRDWPKYRDAWLNVCDHDNIDLTAAVFADSGTDPAEFGLNVAYTCPDRLDEIPSHLRGGITR